MFKDVTLRISNLSCQQCVTAIHNTIKGLPGIVSIDIKRESEQVDVNVSYESGKASFEKIRSAVVELGYSVDGYIIHEHSHYHGDIIHEHPHRHGEVGNEYKLPLNPRD